MATIIEFVDGLSDDEMLKVFNDYRELCYGCGTVAVDGLLRIKAAEFYSRPIDDVNLPMMFAIGQRVAFVFACMAEHSIINR